MMNMLLEMLKGLLPENGDYRVRWYKGAPPDQNTLAVYVDDIRDDESPKEVFKIGVEWPK